MKTNDNNYDNLWVWLGDEDFRYHLYEVISLFFNKDNINIVFDKDEIDFNGLGVSGDAEDSNEIDGASDNKQSDLIGNDYGAVDSSNVLGVNGHYNMTSNRSLYLFVDISLENSNYYFNVKLQNSERVVIEDSFNTAEEQGFTGELLNKSRKILKQKLYILLSKHLGKYFPWGCFTGIRPAKIVNKMLDNGENKLEVMNELIGKFLVAPEKAELAYEVAETQHDLRKLQNERSISVYIGIPFCPTRCLYCSFTSNPMGKYENMADTYIDTLIYEMNAVSKRVIDEGLNIESVYIGGGTPTALNKDRLSKLLVAVHDIWFKISGIPVREFSVEAGRPDSIDEEKLSVLRDFEVTRISINPQTFNDSTLKIIGRGHTSHEFDVAFKLARKMGFNNINTDLIAGLPGEDLEMFNISLSEILKYKPENLTVHAMSIKKASELRQRLDQFRNSTNSKVVEEMIDLAHRSAKDSMMKPYYLYRQKNMLGNLENTGYTVDGHGSLYNIHIMEEDQTVLAFGAGSVSKYVTFKDGECHIERTFNVKGVEEYIRRCDEMVNRKLNHPYFI